MASSHILILFYVVMTVNLKYNKLFIIKMVANEAILFNVTKSGNRAPIPTTNAFLILPINYEQERKRFAKKPS